jgi:hypothetical protein
VALDANMPARHQRVGHADFGRVALGDSADRGARRLDLDHGAERLAVDQNQVRALGHGARVAGGRVMLTLRAIGAFGGLVAFDLAQNGQCLAQALP